VVGTVLRNDEVFSILSVHILLVKNIKFTFWLFLVYSATYFTHTGNFAKNVVVLATYLKNESVLGHCTYQAEQISVFQEGLFSNFIYW